VGGGEAVAHQLLPSRPDVSPLAQQLRSPEMSFSVLRLSLEHLLQKVVAPVERLAGLLLALNKHRR
jgi:hypothetical protein